jgi:tetratricopeptide (TPR) repeat protein
MLSIYDWRWQEADEAIARSLALAPNDAEIANFAGDYLRLVVDNPRLIETEGRAVELNPLQSVNHTDLAYAYLGLRQYEQAIEPGRRGRSMAPELLDTNYEALVRAYGPLRRFREMHEVLAAARLIATPQSPTVAAVFEGRTADGLRLLEEFRPHVEQGGYSPAEYGYHFLRLGQPEKAAHWLRLGAKGHDASLVDPAVVDFDLVAANPVTRVVLEEPGLKELVEVRARNLPRRNEWITLNACL